MTQLRNAARLAEKSIQIFATGQTAGTRHLDGHDTVQFRITRLVHGAERANADLGEQFKAAKLAPLPGNRLHNGRAALQAEARTADGTDNLLRRQLRAFNGIATVR